MSGHPDEVINPHAWVSQADLESWGRDIFKRIDIRMDVVFQQMAMGEQHTMALMAAQLYTTGRYTYEDAAINAKKLYRETAKTLEKDRTVVGAIKERTCQP